MSTTTAPPPAAGEPAPASTPPAIFAEGLNFTDEWHTALPEEFHGLAKGTKSLPELVGRLKVARDDIATRGSGLKVPGEKATDEERAQFRSSLLQHLGVPQKAEDYDLSPPEGMEADADLIKEISAIMPQAGVTKEGAKLISDTYTKVMAARVEQIRAEAARERAEDREALAKEHGDKIDSLVAAAKAVAKEAGWPEETMDPTHEAFIGAKPFNLIQGLIARIAKAEGVERSGGPGTGASTVRDAAWAKRVMAGLEPESAAYKDRAHPENKAVHAAVLAAYKVSHPGKK